MDLLVGEGAGIVVLEELEHAKARGAHIYCEMVGYGVSCDAHHITAPLEDGSGGAKAMINAIKDAGLVAEDVTYINAHGTSTPLNDKGETMAIKSALGEAAKKGCYFFDERKYGALFRCCRGNRGGNLC